MCPVWAMEEKKNVTKEEPGRTKFIYQWFYEIKVVEYQHGCTEILIQHLYASFQRSWTEKKCELYFNGNFSIYPQPCAV